MFIWLTYILHHIFLKILDCLLLQRPLIYQREANVNNTKPIKTHF